MVFLLVLTFGLVGALVPDHLALHKGREFLERLLQHIVVHLIAQISNKYPAGRTTSHNTQSIPETHLGA